MRSLRLETKFHHTNRGASSGSPPISITREVDSATMATAVSRSNTSIVPASARSPSTPTVPSTTYSARSCSAPVQANVVPPTSVASA